jgi:uncharacterized protein YbjT (DUF2867 family)
MRIALIGATGLIGSHLLPELAHQQLLVLARRPTGAAGVREIIGTAEVWPRMLDGESIDAAVSALGTTWKKARSWEAFEAIDRTAVVNFARAAREAGARQMVTVSSVGAHADSPNDYLALKARAEGDLRALEFDRLDIFRPGLLRGERGVDRRLGERLAIAASPLTNLVLRGRLDRFAAIDAKAVARGIAAVIGASASGCFVHHNREILALARA